MPEMSTIIASVEQTNGDWFRVHTRPDAGQQYGKKFDTKRGEIANAAQQLIGQSVIIEYTERQSDKINPNNNRPYINRYLESVRAGQPSAFTPVAQSVSTFSGSATTPTPSSATVPAGVGDSPGARAGRNNIAAAAVESLIQLSDGNPETIQRLLDGLASWSETGTPIFATPQPAAPFSGDDDIPF